MGSVHSKEASVLKSPYVAAKHGIVSRSTLSGRVWVAAPLAHSIRLVATRSLGIMGFARAVAKEGGEFGIASNVVCPGFVLTPLVEKQIPEQAKVRATIRTNRTIESMSSSSSSSSYNISLD